MSKCKTCGVAEGFVVLTRVTGNTTTFYKSDGMQFEDNGQMYEGISEHEELKRTECLSCGGFYGWTKDVVIER